jgi:hypothetical protein
MRGLHLTLVIIIAAVPALAAEDEPAAIVELGGAGEWGAHHGDTAYGPSLAVETTPIADVLELEAGTTEFLPHGASEWDTDFLFKKPYTLSDRLEFMAGIGPTWSHSVTHAGTGDSFGVEAALDFMWWPWPERKFGLFAEPSYGWDFGPGHAQSLSLSVGLLIPIP